LGGGLEITILSAVPKGSGLGTSSILAATVLGALSDACCLNWDKTEICNRTLALEQMLTTGGGWQDQYGGILYGIKYLETIAGYEQIPMVKWLPDALFTKPEFTGSILLYYTGITRVAKTILGDIVRGMFLNSSKRLPVIHEIREHGRNTFDTLQHNDFNALGEMIGRSWMLNQMLDSGTNTPEIGQIISRIEPYCIGMKLLGAGGGGYMLVIARDVKAAFKIRGILTENPPNNRARFVEMQLSTYGLQVSRS
jgi:galactokinase/mevalonate kinase-like predicted kinase